jgi:hypothetical protein
MARFAESGFAARPGRTADPAASAPGDHGRSRVFLSLSNNWQNQAAAAGGPALLIRRRPDFCHLKRPAQVSDPDRAEISVAGRGAGRPLHPGDGGACTATYASRDRRLPRLQRLVPVTPVRQPIPECSSHETSARVHWRSPLPAFLSPVAPGRNGGSWALPRASHPAGQDPAAYAGAGTGLRHWPAVTSSPSSAASFLDAARGRGGPALLALVPGDFGQFLRRSGRHALHEAVERLVECVRVDLREDPPEGPRAGRPGPAGQWVRPAAEDQQRLARAVGRPFRDRGRRIVPGRGERAHRRASTNSSGCHRPARLRGSGPAPAAPAGTDEKGRRRGQRTSDTGIKLAGAVPGTASAVGSVDGLSPSSGRRNRHDQYKSFTGYRASHTSPARSRGFHGCLRGVIITMEQKADLVVVRCAC